MGIKSLRFKIRNCVTTFFILNFSFLIFHSATAQDSSRLRISLLTCTPGEELYSTFGHSAFRVVDSTSLTDIVYNYGTFNFDDGLYADNHSVTNNGVRLIMTYYF